MSNRFTGETLREMVKDGRLTKREEYLIACLQDAATLLEKAGDKKSAKEFRDEVAKVVGGAA